MIGNRTVRPCFLVVDREYAGSISTRKLVIETAKFNVITAYSGAEAIDTLRTFPAVSGVVLDAGVRDLPCTDLIAALRQIRPKITIVAIDAPGGDSCVDATHHLASFDPTQLLFLLKTLEPEQAARIAEADASLQ